MIDATEWMKANDQDWMFHAGEYIHDPAEDGVEEFAEFIRQIATEVAPDVELTDVEAAALRWIEIAIEEAGVRHHADLLECGYDCR